MREIVKVHRIPETHRRSAVGAIWVIAGVPLFAVFLCFTIEIGNIWLARSQLENALESAALGAALDWGRSGVGSTVAPRDRGVEMFSANTIRGLETFTIATNFGAMTNQNDDEVNGNLVFGALTTTTSPFVFDPDTVAGCGNFATVIDVTGSTNLLEENAWGVSFPAPSTSTGLRLLQVVIDLRAGTDPDAVFDFTTDQPSASTVPGDLVGLTADQIVFTPDSGTPSTLTITFLPSVPPDPLDPPDLGVDEGDSFRFRARINNVSTGTGNDDGDGVGQVGATVTIRVVDTSNVITDITAPFIDTKLGFPPNNDDQSIASLSGGSGQYPAVKAQATISVPSVLGPILGVTFGPWQFASSAVASYNCATGKAKLIQIQ